MHSRPPDELLAGRAEDFGADEAPVEVRVVRGEHISGDDVEKLRLDSGECRRVLHHVPGDVGELRDEGRNRAARIHQRLENLTQLPVANDYRCDFGDSIGAVRAAAGRLHIHYYI